MIFDSPITRNNTSQFNEGQLPLDNSTIFKLNITCSLLIEMNGIKGFTDICLILILTIESELMRMINEEKVGDRRMMFGVFTIDKSVVLREVGLISFSKKRIEGLLLR